MHYRRVYREGGSYFFTVITEKRRKIFADDDNVKYLRTAFKTVMQKRPFVIDAAVVLPDHLHFILYTSWAWQRLLNTLATYQNGIHQKLSWSIYRSKYKP